MTNGQIAAVIKDMVLACGSGMNWMDQVSRAKLSSATRGILDNDMGMCSGAMFRARALLESLRSKTIPKPECQCLSQINWTTVKCCNICGLPLPSEKWNQ